jgi:hypothetical protein
MSEELVSPETVVVIVAGLAIGAAYLRYMWTALQRAVRTLDDPDEREDRYRSSLRGAAIAVAGSIGAIAVYGAGPGFLYAGPLLALASAIAVTGCLRLESVEE